MSSNCWSSGALGSAALCAMALLELLAAAAPARIVAAELLVLRGDDLPRRCRRRRRAAHADCRGARGRGHARRRNRVRTCGRLVRVRQVPVLRPLRLLELGCLGGSDLRVEEREDDLLADLLAELLEHHVPFGAVLDERVLLRERAQVDALAHVVHRLEMLAPAHVDDLQDHEPLELAHDRTVLLVNTKALLALLVLVHGVVDELVDELVPVEPDLVAQLVGRDVGAVEVLHREHERVDVPLLGVLRREELVDRPLDHLRNPLAHVLRQVVAFQHAAPLLVDHHALRVHDVVVLEDVLAHDEVLLLDLLLRSLDLVREDLRLHRLVVRELELVHDVLDPVAREQAHEIVLAGEVEARLARVALAAGTTAELVVDSPRFVPLGTEHVEAAQPAHGIVDLDVDAAAGHVRRDRDGADLSGVLDDLRLALVLLRVEDGVGDASALEQLREVLRRLDGDRADEHRLSRLVALDEVVDDGVELRFFRLEDEILLVVPPDLHVRRDLDDVQVVDLDELLLLGLRGARHAGELVVEAEVVLEGDRRERDVLLLDADALFRLDRLVQALAPAPAFHDPAGELVDDLDLAVLHDVVDVVLVERLRLQRLIQMVHELHVARVVEVVDRERALDLLDGARLGRDRLELLVVDVVRVGNEALLHLLRRDGRHRLDDAREVVIDLRSGLRLAGDDQRRARLVDEDRVDLVDDRVRVAALHDALQRDGHVVAQVVEAELRVGAVRDVAAVGDLALGERHHVLDVTDGGAEALVDGARPLGVALGQVVVDGHEMHVGARQRVEEERLCRDERLSLAGLHLGDVALVEDDAAHHLHLEELDLPVAAERLADGGVRLEEQLLQ